MMRPAPGGLGRRAALETWGRPDLLAAWEAAGRPTGLAPSWRALCDDFDARWAAGEISAWGYNAAAECWVELPSLGNFFFEESGARQRRGDLVRSASPIGAMVHQARGMPREILERYYGFAVDPVVTSRVYYPVWFYRSRHVEPVALAEGEGRADPRNKAAEMIEGLEKALATGRLIEGKRIRLKASRVAMLVALGYGEDGPPGMGDDAFAKHCKPWLRAKGIYR